MNVLITINLSYQFSSFSYLFSWEKGWQVSISPPSSALKFSLNSCMEIARIQISSAFILYSHMKNLPLTTLKVIKLNHKYLHNWQFSE